MSIPSDYIITALIVFGVIASAAGFLMRREVDRRLKRTSNTNDYE
jgi:hypothetical protein